MPTVATTGDVLALTGVTPSSTELALAHTDIEIFCGRIIVDEGEDVFNDTDLAWLKRAVSHQARFRKQNPHLFDSIDVEQSSDPSGSIVVSNELLMAPLARKSLNNVSWMGPRTIRNNYGYNEYPSPDSLEGGGWECL